MRCLHCKHKLPLGARFVGRLFCNEAHKAAYNRDRDQLVVEALQQTEHLIRRSVIPIVDDDIRDEEELSGGLLA